MISKSGKYHRFSPIAYLRLARRYVSEKPYMMLLAATVGLITGLACVVLKTLIKWVSSGLTSHFSHTENWTLLILPLIGLGLAGIFCRYMIKRPLSQGTDRLIDFLEKGGYAISKKLTFGPIIANVLTLGFGGSAGAEGPIAVTGASISGNIARKLGLTPEEIRIFIGCGAGAGIAAIFKAPVGGMLFALEILRLPFTTFTVLALLLSCLASALTCYIFTGFTFDVFLNSAESFDAGAYLALAVFGVVAGLYSLFYNHCVRVAGRMLGRMKARWLQIVVAGAVLGVLLFLFPALYGEGYGVMDKMLNGHVAALYDGTPLPFGEGFGHMAIVVGCILLVKGIAVGLTTNAGVAGDFAPTLFAGSLAGLLFATAANHLCGCTLPVGDFALIGMCAVFAGVIRAPFMAMFLTPEMTGNFTLFLPMVLASALCYGVVRLVKSKNFYHEEN